jgi:uncharacterized DUF497 family protein
MGFEFDPAKDAVNRAKHGLSLADAALVLDHPAVFELLATRPSDGEIRVKAIAPISQRLHVVVCTVRGVTRRPISFRKANDAEERLYRTASGSN